MFTFRGSVKDVLGNRNLLAVTLAHSLLMFASFLWKPYWSLYILEIGGSKNVVGALSTLQAFSNLVLLLPGGMLADRFGRKRVILVSSFFSFLSPILLLYSQNWVGLIPGIIASAFSTLSIPAQSALIAESLPPEKRATAFSIYTMAWYMFIVVAYPLSGFIMDTYGIVPGTQFGLIFSFFITIPIILIQWKLLTETIKPNTTYSENRVASIRIILMKLRIIPKVLWILLIVAFFSSFGFQLFWSFVVVYCVEQLKMNMIQWSIVGIIGNLVAAFLMIPVGYLSDKALRKPYVIISQVLVSVSSLGYIFSKGFLGIAVTRIVGGIGEGLGGNVFSSTGGPVWQALVTDLAPPEIKGSVLGLLGTIAGFASTPAPWIGGYLYENISPDAPFYISFILGGFGVTLFTLFVNESHEIDTKQ